MAPPVIPTELVQNKSGINIRLAMPGNPAFPYEGNAKGRGNPAYGINAVPGVSAIPQGLLAAWLADPNNAMSTIAINQVIIPDDGTLATRGATDPRAVPAGAWLPTIPQWPRAV